MYSANIISERMRQVKQKCIEMYFLQMPVCHLFYYLRLLCNNIGYSDEIADLNEAKST